MIIGGCGRPPASSGWRPIEPAGTWRRPAKVHVLPGDHAPVTAKPAAGTYPAWSIRTEYHAGDRVLYAGLPYQAKWNNEGTAPQAGTGSSGSPWQSLETIPGEPTPSASATP